MLNFRIQYVKTDSFITQKNTAEAVFNYIQLNFKEQVLLHQFFCF